MMISLIIYGRHNAKLTGRIDVMQPKKTNQWSYYYILQKWMSGLTSLIKTPKEVALKDGIYQVDLTASEMNADSIVIEEVRGDKMSNFACEKCGTLCFDTKHGYATGCKHYPKENYVGNWCYTCKNLVEKESKSSCKVEGIEPFHGNCDAWEEK